MKMSCYSPQALEFQRCDRTKGIPKVLKLNLLLDHFIEFGPEEGAGHRHGHDCSPSAEKVGLASPKERWTVSICI